MQNIPSKLPNVGTTIFSVMSSLAARYGAVNLSQGFPDFDCDEVLKDLVVSNLRMGHNQYAPMPGIRQLREVLSEKVRRLYEVEVDPETEVTVTAGATQALFTAISAFVRPGDEVVLIEPAYDSYRPAIELNGGRVVAYELTAPDYSISWEDFARLISPHTRMVLINSPHNPTGRVLSREDLEALQGILEGTSVVLLSDEVYEHLVFDGQEHQSVLRFPGLFQRSLATFSFGKTFHNTGWKTGYCIGPEPLMREFRKVHQYNVFSVHTPTQYALAEYLQDPGVYAGLADFYQRKRDYFLKILEKSPFEILPCGGTYFQLVRYQSFSNLPDIEFTEWLTREAGIAAIPVSVFYESRRDDRVIRFCFAKTEQLLNQAAEKLGRLGQFSP